MILTSLRAGCKIKRYFIAATPQTIVFHITLHRQKPLFFTKCGVVIHVKVISLKKKRYMFFYISIWNFGFRLGYA